MVNQLLCLAGAQGVPLISMENIQPSSLDSRLVKTKTPYFTGDKGKVADFNSKDLVLVRGLGHFGLGRTDKVMN
jgi:hypothetical protein